MSCSTMLGPRNSRLGHLYGLGHRRIAFMRGQPFSSDSDERWSTLVAVAKRMGIEIKPEASGEALTVT